MKKMMLLGALLVCVAAVSQAQESRQDISVSADGVFGPDVHGLGAQEQAKGALGFLASYRYSITPRSGLEPNYGFLQGATKYISDDFQGPLYEHDRQQEITGAYVYSRNYKRFNPFVEIGVGGMIFTEIRDFKTDELSTKQNTNIGGLAGGGLAYELSPSFDLRVEYRGFLVKAPDYGFAPYKTNRYEWLSLPAIGVAYHF